MIKKIALVFFWATLQIVGFAAVRTISTSGGNYNSTSTWVEGVVPTSADDIVATDSSGALYVNVASNGKTLNLLSYKDSLIVNANLTIAGSITLDTGMTYVGSATLICSATGTLTSNGKTISGDLQLNGTSQTFTLADNWILNGALKIGGTTSVILNGTGYTISAAGLSLLTACKMQGAATAGIILTGGSWSQSNSSNINTIRNDITLAGNVTVSGTVYFGTDQMAGTGNLPTLTYSSGTITTTGSTLFLISYTSNTEINTNGMSWNNVVTQGQTGHYFNSNMDVKGNFTYSYTGLSGQAQWLYNNKITVWKDLIGNANLITSGTTKIEMVGKGRWYCNTSDSYLQLDLTFNTTDTITVSGSVCYGANWNGSPRTATLTYTSGTILTTGSTLTIGTSCCNDYAQCLLNCSGITWNNVSIGRTTYVLGGYVTLGADLNVGGNLTFGQASGAQGITVNGLFNINVWGNLSNVASSSAPTGTATIVLKGKGTWNNTSTGGIQLNVDINTTDTITISGSVLFGGSKILTHTSGVINCPSGTLTLATCSLILNSNTLNIANLSVSGSTVFGGNYGWIAGNFYANTPGSITTFKVGNTYSITNGIVVTGTAATRCNFVSTTSGTMADLNISNSATEDIAFCNVSDIRSIGQVLWSYKGNMTNVVGCKPLPTEPRTISYTF